MRNDGLLFGLLFGAAYLACTVLGFTMLATVMLWVTMLIACLVCGVMAVNVWILYAIKIRMRNSLRPSYSFDYWYVGQRQHINSCMGEYKVMQQIVFNLLTVCNLWTAERYDTFAIVVGVITFVYLLVWEVQVRPIIRGRKCSK